MELPQVELDLFLEMTDDIAQSEQLFERMSAFALKFDCPWIAYGPLASKQGVFKPNREGSVVMWNYPAEWQERYSRMGYAKIDPLIKKGRKEAGPFRWSEVYTDESITEDGRRVLDEAATFGLRSGVTVPLHGPGDSFRFVSFAHPRTANCRIERSPTCKWPRCGFIGWLRSSTLRLRRNEYITCLREKYIALIGCRKENRHGK